MTRVTLNLDTIIMTSYVGYKYRAAPMGRMASEKLEQLVEILKGSSRRIIRWKLDRLQNNLPKNDNAGRRAINELRQELGLPKVIIDNKGRRVLRIER